LAAAGSRLRQSVQHVQACTLAQLEDLFSSCLPHDLLPKTKQKDNSRDRLYTQRRTFWSFLWQCLNPQTSCREVVRQIQALFTLQAGPVVSEENGAYCRARRRLPTDQLAKALTATAAAVQRHGPTTDFLQGRPVKVVDGSSLTMPDTPANRSAYPIVQTSQTHGAFPMMRLVVLFGLASGAILTMLSGNLHLSELRLFHSLMSQLGRGDIVLGDRGFGNFLIVSLLQDLGIDFIGRSLRRVDGRRRRQRLGAHDWLVQWRRPAHPSPILSPEAWGALPLTRTVRIVRGSLYRPGFRVRQVTLVTTLLEPKLYPAQEILRAYARRWRLEMCLDDLKTTLGMEMLRCQSPAMVEKEVLMNLVAHNLIRFIMAQAATDYAVALERISFKGTMDGLRQFSQAMAQARSKRKRRQLWEELLRTIAADLVPDRPERREPRAVKRKKNRYPRLNVPRRQFRDHPKRHARRAKSRLRKLIS
jgi:hypothetical protein